MKNCKLPTNEECEKLLDEYCVPLHIREHCRAVADYALEIANRFIACGIDVDTELIEKACILHDIARMCDIVNPDYSMFDSVSERDKQTWKKIRTEYKGLCHEEAAYQILKDRYPELALVIKRHKYLAIAYEDQKPQSWEEKIVYYADKRIMHTKKVSLRHRLEDGHKRNILSKKKRPADLGTEKVDKLIFELECEIFSKINKT
jgi:HD superfamily phosphohydrolase YqeK